MITFLDLIKKEDFREFVSKRIASVAGKSYSFPVSFPKLYRYRSLSSYAIDDIINNKITLSSIGEFNDIFDGAIHQYGSKQEIEEAAEEKWTRMEAMRINAHLPEGLLQREDIVNPYIIHFTKESLYKFRMLDYLGTYVYCFSIDNTSTLMWAHYADSNKGVCIEYDFNELPVENLLRKSIFPVAYTTEPISVADLINDNGHQIYQYPLDAAVLCTALNKSSIWQYEKEWRFVWVLSSSSEVVRRITINSIVPPARICLGYHFLKPFFYYNYNDTNEIQKCTEVIYKFIDLICFLCNNNIPVAIMIPSVGSYHLNPCEIPTNKLYCFMIQQFMDKQPVSMRYYYTIHDHLMNLIDKTDESTHV